MTSSEYWKKREADALKSYQKDEEAYYEEIQEIYADMMERIQKEIDSFYIKYAVKEDISMAEAKKRVSLLDIKAYARKAKKYVRNRDFSDEANEEMRLYNATMKINRLEMLKANIGLELVSGYDELQKYFEQTLTDRTLDEFKRQAGILGETITDNAEMAHSIVNASFHNATFSDRIWMHQDVLKNQLSSLLQTGLIQGRNPRQLAVELRKYFNVGIGNSERLMRTELARVQTAAQKRSFEKNGFEEYEFIANGTACEKCAGLDGQHFKIAKMMPGTNAPPMHPNCRCSTAAYQDSAEYEAWLDFLDKGGNTEKWQKENSIAKESGDAIMKSKDAIFYEGIPKNWKKLDNLDTSLKNVNPSYSQWNIAYRRNCANCAVAYEMRKRGYDVVAKPVGKNHYLQRYPEAAWSEPDIIETSGTGLKDIENTMLTWPEGARAEITIIWKNSLEGHVLIAENEKKKIIFLDVQSGHIYDETIFEDAEENKTRFWRIDNIETSDRGITACEAGDF